MVKQHISDLFQITICPRWLDASWFDITVPVVLVSSPVNNFVVVVSQVRDSEEFQSNMFTSPVHPPSWPLGFQRVLTRTLGGVVRQTAANLRMTRLIFMFDRLPWTHMARYPECTTDHVGIQTHGDFALERKTNNQPWVNNYLSRLIWQSDVCIIDHLFVSVLVRCWASIELVCNFNVNYLLFMGYMEGKVA